MVTAEVPVITRICLVFDVRLVTDPTSKVALSFMVPAVASWINTWVGQGCEISCSQMARSEMQLVCWMVSWNLDFTRAMCLEESVGFVSVKPGGLQVSSKSRAISEIGKGSNNSCLALLETPQTSGNMNATGEDLEIWSPKVSGT